MAIRALFSYVSFGTQLAKAAWEFTMRDETTLLLDPHVDFDLEGDYQPTPWSPGERSDVIERCTGFIDEPHDPSQRYRFRLVKADLVSGDGFAAAAHLVTDEDSFGGPYRLLSCYSMAILAVDACREAGARVHGDDLLLRTIRSQARNELALLPAHGTVEWIIPATPADRTAVHVAALLSARLGTIARPWLWPMIPSYGQFSVVGKPDTSNSIAAHQRCLGHSSFHTIAERLHHIH